MKKLGAPNYILVQPWFSAKGHPAQSLLNFARIVPREKLALILISDFDPVGPFGDVAIRLARIASLMTFPAAGTDLRWNTLLAGGRLLLLSLSAKFRGSRPIFVDSDIFVFVLLNFLGVFGMMARPAAVILHGPDRLQRHKYFGAVLRSLLAFSRPTIFLRSPQHLAAWMDYCPKGCFKLLPPVEAAVAEKAEVVPIDRPEGPLAIGVIGQIRPGKNIPALLALADQNPASVKVTVQGPLSEQDMPEVMAALNERENVHVGYMSEAEMLAVAGRQDYLACLFEKSWDLSSESATFWLAIKVLKPVVSFSEGWVADRIRDTGCGVLVSPDDLFLLPAKLPRAGTLAYQSLQDALQRFRAGLEPRMIWATLEAMME